MELELKHIAPYLPYGLKIQYKGRVIPLSGIKNSTAWSDQLSIQIDKQIWTYGYEIKPILHPLSALTKEIEVNGEKFVPSEKIDSDFIQINGYQSRMKYYKSEIDKIDLIEINGISHGILAVDYWIINQLFEWHFDAFGLIEQGLAIDINTI